jgi:hypothetical protein
MIAAAFDEAEARDPQHLRTWVVLVDGADHQLALIRAEAARRGVTVHIVVDIIHVLEYLWGAAWSFHPAGDPAAEDWVAARALAVLAGDSARASRRSPPKPVRPDWKEAGAPGPTHASATWATSMTSCATTRPSRPAGRSRPGSSRAHAATSLFTELQDVVAGQKAERPRR